MDKLNTKHTILLIAIALLTACGPVPSKEGQKQPIVSLSGKYMLEMPISKSNKNWDYPVWTPTIKDKNGKIIYTDQSSNLSGYHNSYWDWGVIPENGNDILWVYNSDIGEVTNYYTKNGNWEKSIYDIKNGKLNPPEIIKKKLYRCIKN